MGWIMKTFVVIGMMTSVVIVSLLLALLIGKFIQTGKGE